MTTSDREGAAGLDDGRHVLCRGCRAWVAVREFGWACEHGYRLLVEILHCLDCDAPAFEGVEAEDDCPFCGSPDVLGCGWVGIFGSASDKEEEEDGAGDA